MTHIDPVVFDGLPNLRYINLRENAFETLDADLIQQNMERVVFLDVRDNPFTCNCSLEWLGNYLLKSFNFTENYKTANFSSEDSFSFMNLFESLSQVKCQNPPQLRGKLLKKLNRDDFGCFELDTKIPIIIAILIGVLLMSGVIILFVIRCKYRLAGLVKSQWFVTENDTSINSMRNDLNYRKTSPDFVIIPNMDLNIEESNRLTVACEEAVRYPLKMTPMTEL